MAAVDVPRAGGIFLSTLSLRRATGAAHGAEQTQRHFYPRSPCGERRSHCHSCGCRTKFLSTLSLRRATLDCRRVINRTLNFYPRSPCGERHLRRRDLLHAVQFLSTLSLRRATADLESRHHRADISIHALLAESDFGQRLVVQAVADISIHALLAESDYQRQIDQKRSSISIHALLAESDSKSAQNSGALLRI